MTAAGLAFAGAWWLVRRQLRHDRDLFREQLTAARESRRAEIRRLAAYRLGESLIGAADEWYGMSPAEAYERLGKTGFTERIRATPGADAISDARDRAEHELDLDDTLTRVWRLKLVWWDAAQTHRNDPRVTALAGSAQRSVMFDLVDQQFTEYDGLVRDLGVQLMRWDGEGDLPSIPASAIPKVPADRFAEMSLSVLDGILTRRQERLEKQRAKKATDPHS
ncbi:hypothetical protein [Microbacterium sp. SLBN-146]|uniref:hypothetical protein n=1 Tax=Microbacterium sp. SLBN-146 TaxID=2768457 RepID=UPI001153E557|nr:hypothetical protein [Microbacterium sp. SLBN-146]